ncbi:hypothetical protein AB3N59_15765 [Leptospira sp. WS92.C1]
MRSSRSFDSVFEKSIRSLSLILIFPFTIIAGNFYLLNSTKVKIDKFSQQPPFLAFDFTNSYLSNNSSRISNLLDKDPSTTWVKFRDSTKKEDFQLELRQTHHLERNKPKISQWKYLHIEGCARTLGNLKMTLVLRESIDMDKELRLPKDKILGEQILKFSETKHFKIPVVSYYKPEPSAEFPQNMFIWTIQGIWTEDPEDIRREKFFCLQDIWLSEN